MRLNKLTLIWFFTVRLHTSIEVACVRLNCFSIAQVGNFSCGLPRYHNVQSTCVRTNVPGKNVLKSRV